MPPIGGPGATHAANAQCFHPESGASRGGGRVVLTVKTGSMWVKRLDLTMNLGL